MLAGEPIPKKEARERALNPPARTVRYSPLGTNSALDALRSESWDLSIRSIRIRGTLAPARDPEPSRTPYIRLAAVGDSWRVRDFLRIGKCGSFSARSDDFDRIAEKGSPGQG